MRVLICGGRNIPASEVWFILDGGLRAEVPGQITSIIHGAAPGVDRAAGEWAESEDIHVIEYPANWKKHGKAAGPIRNRKMLEEGKPDIVVALPGGRGTRNMKQQAEDAGIPVISLP